MTSILFLVLLATTKSCNSHSWIINVGHDGGLSRGGNIGGDSVLQRYFCPLTNLDDCQPDPKHGIVLTEKALRPCRENIESQSRASVRAGDGLYLHWMGNGHVANGQSDGTCVRVMFTNFEADPKFSDFTQIPGAECIDYWHYDSGGIPKTDTYVSIPVDVPPGKYTILWYWDFTDFWYSSCADIDIKSPLGPTKSPKSQAPNSTPIPSKNKPTSPAPSPSPKPTLDQDDVIKYFKNGCNKLKNPDIFCVGYLGRGSYCKSYNVDACDRSVCHGGNFLLPCHSSIVPSSILEPSVSPTSEVCPPGQSNFVVEFQTDSKSKKQNRYFLYQKKNKSNDKGKNDWKLVMKRKKIKKNFLDTYAICTKDDKCQKFVIKDAGGDGICCDYGNGYYKLIKGGIVLINSSIPNGKKESVTFGANCDDNVDNMKLYLEIGCNNSIIPLQFCVNSFGSGSYCKDYQEDKCGRSVCHGHDHEDLNLCP